MDTYSGVVDFARERKVADHTEAPPDHALVAGEVFLWGFQGDPLKLYQHGSVSKPCTPGEHQNNW